MKCEYQGECQLECFDEEDCFVKSLFSQIRTLEKDLKEKNEDIKNSPLCYMCKEEDCLKKQLKRCEQKLEKIKTICQSTLTILGKHSGINAYVSGRCIEAGDVLRIIEGAKE